MSKKSTKNKKDKKSIKDPKDIKGTKETGTAKTKNKSDKTDKKSKNKKFRKVLLTLFTLIIVGTIVAIGVDIYVILSTKDNIIDVKKASELKDVDCILVLGCQVYNNYALSPMLCERVDKSLEVYDTGVTKKILASGDNGTVEYNEVFAMKNYILSTSDVYPEDVFMDHAGFSTYESIYRARDVFKVKKVIIVTHKYHLYRSIYIANKLGLEAYGVAVDDNHKGKYYREFREVLARDKDFIKCIFKPGPKFLGDVIDIHGDGNET